MTEKRETARGGKLRSKSKPILPRDSLSHSVSEGHSCSVDSKDTHLKLKGLSSDDASDSDSNCYVSPLELNHAVRISYAEDKNPDKSKHTDEYDYPYITRAFTTSIVTSSPSQGRPQNVTAKNVRHNRVHIQKLTSFDTNTSPDHSTYELLSAPRSAGEKMVRASSHVEILELLFEAEDYIKMRPSRAMKKSHSCDEARFLWSVLGQSETPGTTSVNSPMEHNNYKSINRLTIATDGMYAIQSKIFCVTKFP